MLSKVGSRFVGEVRSLINKSSLSNLWNFGENFYRQGRGQLSCRHNMISMMRVPAGNQTMTSSNAFHRPKLDRRLRDVHRDQVSSSVVIGCNWPLQPDENQMSSRKKPQETLLAVTQQIFMPKKQKQSVEDYGFKTTERTNQDDCMVIVVIRPSQDSSQEKHLLFEKRGTSSISQEMRCNNLIVKSSNFGHKYCPDA